MADDILNEVVSPEDLTKFERMYHEELHNGSVSRMTQFNYSFCLVRSEFCADIRKGILLLEELFKTEIEDIDRKRDYLYYLAIGNARIKEYQKSLKYCRAFLAIEPENPQVQHLESVVKKRMETEGLKGIALAGGAVLALGGLIGLGLAMARKGNKESGSK